MKVFRIRGKLKKIITAIAITVITFGCMQPIEAKCAVSNFDTVYQSNSNTLLGMAADFGIFVKEDLRTTSHNDSNFACGKLYLKNNITLRTDDAISYAGEVLSSGCIDKGYLYVSKGKVTKGTQYWMVDSYNVSDKFKGAVYAPSFIDLPKEFDKLTALANTMSTYGTQNTTYDFTQNNMKITCTSSYNVLNLEANQLNGNVDQLNIENLRGNKLLIVNVDMSKYSDSTYYFSRRIKLDKQLDAFDSDASNVIWNFKNYSGTISTGAETAGVILAPQANVIVNSGTHVGIVIARSYSNNSELHYVPFKYKDRTPVTVAIQSVDGNCCPSKPLGGVSLAVYTTDGVLVSGTEKMVAADSSGNYVARWAIDKPGSYYIQETQVVTGYVKTPVKARFDVTEVDGSLKLIMIIGKEADGYTNTIKNIDGEDRFYIRHYSNEVYAVALDAKNLKLLYNTAFEVYKYNGTPGNTDTMIAQGSAASDGFFQVNIPGTGFYYIKQTVTQNGYVVSSEIKQFAVYTTPIGHQLTVELDDVIGLSVLSILQKHLGTTMNIEKLTSSMNKELIAYGFLDGSKTNEYDSVTDACIIYMNDKIK